MTLDQLANIGEIIGSIAVLVSIMYLAVVFPMFPLL